MTSTEPTAPGRSETLLIPRPGGAAAPMTAYLSIPPGDDPRPGVIVIHEIYGLSEHIRQVADRFATSGYAALAVDLFSGRNRAACLWQIFNDLVLRPLQNRRSGVLAEIQRAVDVLQDRPEVDRSRIGVIGFCLGGGYALQLACVDDDVRAASVFYGPSPRPLAAVDGACPIVGSFPGLDLTALSGRQLQTELTRAAVPHDVKVYPGTVHGFFNERMPMYNQTAAEDAWERTIAFFAQHLGEQHRAGQ